MKPDLLHDMGNDMISKILGVIAVAAVAVAVVPVHAAKRSVVGCSGDNLSKAESSVEDMADGDAKWAAEKEMAAAQDALLSGKMGVCGMHLAKVVHAGSAK